MTGDRHSKIIEPTIELGKPERAKKEAENGVKQFKLAMEIVRSSIADENQEFKLRIGHLLRLNHQALEGLNERAGTFRNMRIQIEGSEHDPPDQFEVPELVSEMCDYVNRNWDHQSAIHLAAYLMWRINWIHPFADGNGRTSRIVAYMILNIKLLSILPGSPTIPEQIAANKSPYYNALEQADKIWAKGSIVDVSAMEELLGSLLARQLVHASQQATS